MSDDSQDAVDMLLARQSAIEFLIVGLALALAENKKLPLNKTLDSMRFMTAFVAVTESPEIAKIMLPTLQRLDACANDLKRPRMPLELLLALHADAGPQYREALTTWLSQASQGEIADDLQQLLDKLKPAKKPGV